MDYFIALDRRVLRPLIREWLNFGYFTTLTLLNFCCPNSATVIFAALTLHSTMQQVQILGLGLVYVIDLLS